LYSKERRIISKFGIYLLYRYTHSSTVVNNFDFVKLNVLWVAPQQGQDKVVNWWDWLVNIPKEHVQKVLQES
jgi:hypothetical protein